MDLNYEKIKERVESKIVVGGRGNGKTVTILIREMEAMGIPREMIRQLMTTCFDGGYQYRKKKELEAMYTPVSAKSGSMTVEQWCKQQSLLVHPSRKHLIEELKNFKWDVNKNDDKADATAYAIYAMGEWGASDNIMKCKSCPHAVGVNWCKHHEKKRSEVDKHKHCIVKEDKKVSGFDMARKRFYYTVENRKGNNVNLGDLAYIEHPNKEMEGWYQKVTGDYKGKQRQSVYVAITPMTKRMYLASDLEKYERAIKKCGTITHIIKGADNIMKLLNLHQTNRCLAMTPGQVQELGVNVISIMPDYKAKLERLEKQYNAKAQEVVVRYKEYVEARDDRQALSKAIKDLHMEANMRGGL